MPNEMTLYGKSNGIKVLAVTLKRQTVQKNDDRKKKELYLPNNVKTNLCQQSLVIK